MWSTRRALFAAAMEAPKPGSGFRSEWTVVDGVRIHSRVSAAPATGATPVVLVHGLAVSHRYMMPTAMLLDPAYDVRVVDLPGFGLSGDPEHIQDTHEHAVALAHWLDAIHLGPAVMLGNSFGAQVLVDLLVREPWRCTALVLSGLTMDSAARSAHQQVWRAARDLFHEDPLQLPILVRDFLDAGPGRIWTTLRSALRDDVTAKLLQLEVPTLVLRGELEPIVTSRWAAEAASLVSGAASAVVPGSPHNSVYASADALVAVITPFLDARDPAAPLEDSPLAV